MRDHFTPDSSFASMLDKRGRNGLADELRAFYRMVEDSNIVWIYQAEPKGFGDAVSRGRSSSQETVSSFTPGTAASSHETLTT